MSLSYQLTISIQYNEDVGRWRWNFVEMLHQDRTKVIGWYLINHGNSKEILKDPRVRLNGY